MNHSQKIVNEPCNLSNRLPIFGFICLAILIGCSDPVGAPVNVNTAQQTLVAVMDSWKEGKTPKELLDASPSIVVQETEWTDGVKLLDYEILNDDQTAGPNLIATVKLKLSKVEGKVTEKTATYVVGTCPRLTVFRNMMR